jgi:hypothetical protein
MVNIRRRFIQMIFPEKSHPQLFQHLYGSKVIDIRPADNTFQSQLFEAVIEAGAAGFRGIAFSPVLFHETVAEVSSAGVVVLF